MRPVTIVAVQMDLPRVLLMLTLLALSDLALMLILRVFGLIKPTAFWLGELGFRLGYIITLRFKLVK